MSYENNMEFLNEYWQYIIGGIICYISARFFYVYLGSKYDEAFGDRNETNYIEENNDIDMKPYIPQNFKHVPLVYEKFPENEMTDRAAEFYKFMDMRRTVRNFSKEHVPIEIIRNIIKTAGTAPSGAHTEPWTYVIVQNQELKSQIREIIEKEEKVNYLKRVDKVWPSDMDCLKNSWNKKYLTDAPYLILVFEQIYNVMPDGNKRIHYYNEMSVNIAVGMLLTAIHYAGLVSLTSTPLNCGPTLRTLLERPNNEKLIILLPVGYPEENCMVPDLKRKPLEEIMIEFK